MSENASGLDVRRRGFVSVGVSDAYATGFERVSAKGLWNRYCLVARAQAKGRG